MRLTGNKRRVIAAEDDRRRPVTSTARGSYHLEILATARALSAMVKSVSPDEFYWQEAHYDQDSRQGRELLFLMANHEWVRATSEIVDITRSDAIETAIKIDLDLSQISHEAFRARTGRLWLPVAVLPPEAVRSGADLPPEAPPSGSHSN